MFDWIKPLIPLPFLSLAPAQGGEPNLRLEIQDGHLNSAWRAETKRRYPDVDIPDDPDEEPLQKLEQINAALELYPFTERELREAGWIQDGSNNIQRPSGERLKFRELLFPAASTGIYLPKIPFDPDVHQRIIIFVPGIGTNRSNAMSVADIATHFTTKKFNAALGDERDSGGNPEINFRAYGIPLDMAKNGMGAEAPDILATARGTLAVLRHAHLILQVLYPELPIFVAGRSQGGLIAQIYGQEYGVEQGLFGAIALNPSTTSFRLHTESVRHSENGGLEEIMGGNDDVRFVSQAMVPYRLATPHYRPLLESQAPTLFLLGKDDPSYPSVEGQSYLPTIKSYCSQDPKRRQHEIFSPPPHSSISSETWISQFAHDLWARGSRRVPNPVRETVVRTMKNFIIQSETEADLVSRNEQHSLARKKAMGRVFRTRNAIKALARADMTGAQKAMTWEAFATDLSRPTKKVEIPEISEAAAFAYPLSQKKFLLITRDGKVFSGKGQPNAHTLENLKTLTNHERPDWIQHCRDALERIGREPPFPYLD